MLINLNNHFIKLLLLILMHTDISTSYQVLSLQKDMCSSMDKQKITLGTMELSGLIVTFANDQAITMKGDFSCTFQVNTSEVNNGIFVVIQNTMFHRNATTTDCMDYIEYRKPDSSYSQRYCGQINNDFVLSNDVPDLMPTINSFVDPDGLIDVYIYISKRPYRKILLKVVFTSYRFCFSNPTEEDRKCSDKYIVHCIYKFFFNDGYVNCPYPGCVDEGKCSRKDDNEYLNHTVDINMEAANLVIFFSALVIILTVCCLCCKYKMCCFKYVNQSRVNFLMQPYVTNRNEDVTELRTRMVNNVDTRNATMQDTNLSVDDGQPPSYSSLFPER